MKLICLITISFISFNEVFSQNWVDLKDPQTSLLGRPIQRVNNGSPIFIPDADIPEITYDVIDGAGSVDEYKEKFGKFLSGIIDANGYSVSDIQVRKLRFKSIKAKHFLDGTIPLNTKFAYSGQTADTVTFKIKRKAGVDINFKNILALLTKNIPTAILGDSSSLIKKLEATISDSLSTTISISNPNVFFKARFVQFLNGNPPGLASGKRTWDDYWIHFYNNGTEYVQEYTTLDASKSQLGRQTKRKYPLFWGPKDDKNRTYYLKVQNEQNDLKLQFCRFTTNQGEKILVTIPANKIDGKNIYEYDYSRADEFLYEGITKIVYLAVFAEQINGNQIKIHNYDSVINNKEKIISYMKYPEIKFKYLSKND